MKLVALSALAAASALTLSACGSSSSATTAGGGQGSAHGSAQGSGSGGSGAGPSAGIHVATTSLGKVLVDGRGMTLYVLSADGRDHSTCSSQCLQFWPAAAPSGAGRLAVRTGRTTTPGGTAIATVDGHPVYTFALDHQPGDVNGEGVKEFGGTWDAVSPSGLAVTSGGQGGAASTQPSTGSSAGSSATGHGYGY